jgi:hypothetical protein
MRMDCGSFARTLQVTLPTFTEEIREIAKDYYDGS